MSHELFIGESFNISVAFFFIANIKKLLYSSSTEIRKIFCKSLSSSMQMLSVLISAMRGQKKVRALEDFPIWGQRLVFKNIEDSTCNSLRFQSFAKVIFVHCCTSSDVHEYSTFFHLRECRFLVEEIICDSSYFWKDTANEISFRENSVILIVSYNFVAIRSLLISNLSRVPFKTSDFHTKPKLTDLSASTSNIAIPYESNMFFGY